MENILTEVHIKILKEGIEMPKQQTQYAAGFDITAAIDIPYRLAPGCIKVFGAGFAMEIPPGYEAQIRARSGMAKRGIGIANAPGTIDSDYRGEVGAMLINFSNNDMIIRPGDRIAQMVICKLPEISLVEVVRLSKTVRGTGGFGSTG